MDATATPPRIKSGRSIATGRFFAISFGEKKHRCCVSPKGIAIAGERGQSPPSQRSHEGRNLPTSELTTHEKEKKKSRCVASRHIFFFFFSVLGCCECWVGFVRSDSLLNQHRFSTDSTKQGQAKNIKKRGTVMRPVEDAK